MSDEIELLAKYDKSFHDAYNEYFGKIFLGFISCQRNLFLIFQIPDNKDALFGATDEEIISIKPSLVWKIYAKGDSDNSQTDNSDQQLSSTSIKTDTIEKENCNANERKL